MAEGERESVGTGQRQAVVAVLTDADRVLVIRRGPAVINPGFWTLPSGRIEPGESQAEAVVREVREELGLLVDPVAKVWECDTHDGAFRLHWWLATVVGGELVRDPGEVGEVRWLPAGEFRALRPTFEGDHEFFARVWPTLRRFGVGARRAGVAEVVEEAPGS